MAEFKKGNLTLKERKYIQDNVGVKTLEEIANHLQRSEKQVESFLKSVNKDKADIAQAHSDLKKRPDYLTLKEQLSEEELKYFEYQYSKWMAQLQGDLVSSEDSQIFNLIKLEILMDQQMKNKKNSQDLIDEIDNEIKELRESTIPLEERKIRLTALRNQRHDLQSGLTSAVAVYQTLWDKHDKAMRSMKGTRDQRLKTIDNRKRGFMDLLKEMSSEVDREAMGEEAELNRIAAMKERDKLTQIHTYADGVPGFPFISGKDIVIAEGDKNG